MPHAITLPVIARLDQPARGVASCPCLCPCPCSCVLSQLPAAARLPVQAPP
eukprot:CAMPEP_0202897290 /NCGR_PEP_ID=MMETSP1392-20130828/6093_1 /ASSEMBLY_ACC=CAM_ASM_000868 /TAXON_ID=225041 /ORGANISM="Chlamydomonas chlamydogama, Strain SAG 11-48b" /LENGTH=50 /DNA_ID=CAMNT_0049582889 /DNA_START=60 /DNA_END=208 /DNA_ORIENTATION=-